MNKRQVAEQILLASKNGQWSIGAAFGNASSMSGRPQILQSDVNRALAAWFNDDNVAGVLQLCDTLHITGALTDTEYEQIMQAIENI